MRKELYYGTYVCNHKSKALGFATHTQVIIPQEPDNPTPAEKVLYMLQGLSDNCTAWLNKTRIQQYAEKLEEINYGHTYMEWPGVHDWDFWEECLPIVFDFFEKKM